MYTGLHLEYPLFFSDFNETSILATDFSKNTQISNFMKIHPVGAQSFQADGQTSMTKLIVAFCTSANAPKIVMPINIYILVTDVK
jgi:hypothetical protein